MLYFNKLLSPFSPKENVFILFSLLVYEIVWFTAFFFFLQKLRKMDVMNKLEDLRERIRDKGVDTEVQKLIKLLKSLKVILFPELFNNCIFYCENVS